MIRSAGHGGARPALRAAAPLTEGFHGRSLILIKTGALGAEGLLRARVTLGVRWRLLLDCAAGRERSAEGTRARPRRLRSSFAGKRTPNTN